MWLAISREILHFCRKGREPEQGAHGKTPPAVRCDSLTEFRFRRRAKPPGISEGAFRFRLTSI